MKNISNLVNQFLPGLIFFISFEVLLLFNACASSAEYNPTKMDTSLNQKITYLERAAPDSVIRFIGKTNNNIDDQMKTELKNTGISIETVAGDIFTANGKVENIKKVSILEFIKSLELAKRFEIK
jgi:hypothetical protein